MMKVLMISEFFPPDSKGGGEISAFLLAKALAKKDIDMHILTSTQDKPYFGILDGLKVHHLLKTGNPNTVVGNIKRLNFEKDLKEKVLQLHNKERYDIVHCMNTSSIPAVGCVKKPFIMHVNGPLPFCPKGTLMYKDKVACINSCSGKDYLGCILDSRMVGKMQLNGLTISLLSGPLRFRYNRNLRYLKKFDHYMPISTYMQEMLVKRGVDKKKTTIVYNLLEFKDIGKIKKNKKVLYLGEFTKTKGADIALRAVNSLGADASFHGDGNLRDYLEKNAKKSVKIYGKVPHDQVIKIMMEHDIVLFPSFVGEAFGRVAFEACSLGKIVIASRIGGVTDIIEDNKTGFLFEPGSYNELRSILKDVIQGKKDLDRQEIIRTMRSKFSENDSVDKVIQIYNRLTK